jgi:hypothetical protein
MNRTAKISLLAALFLFCGAAALFRSAIGRRHHATPPAQLYEVVWKQLTAFRESDFSGAYFQASSGFQERLNLDEFAELGRSEYPGLLRATRVEFGPVYFQDREANIPAYFFLPEGDLIPCLYRLIPENNGWKIDEVRVLKRWPANRRLGGLRI